MTVIAVPSSKPFLFHLKASAQNKPEFTEEKFWNGRPDDPYDFVFMKIGALNKRVQSSFI